MKFRSLGLGLFGLIAAGSASVAVGASADDSEPSPADFPRNAKGMTYGSALDSEVEPQLVEAYATNGRVGYVLSIDLNEEVAANPTEALQRNAGGFTIPVYTVDGTTIIGEFVVEPGIGSYETGD
ncbi:MAG: peptidase M56 BlaR1 [Gemmatimonadota bacterium]|nr:peptidase M56 BlaR1 [Gemmatimonadota bacterium]